MARTARKRTTPAKPAQPKADAATTQTNLVTEPAATPTAPDTTTATTTTGDPVATLATAYWRAIDERDEVTGTVPAEPLDAVKVAYRAVPKRNRGDAVTTLGAEAAKRMVGADGTVDAGLAVAMGTLAALFAQLNAERPVRNASAAPHDPVPGVAGMLAALDLARDGILANLTDDQRERVEKIDPQADAEAFATAGTTLVALARISERTINGRRRSTRSSSSGTRSGGPGRDLAQLVRDALNGATGPVTLGAIAREHGVSTGALDNRWTKDNIEGVSAVHDPNGRKAFQAA